ncbi:MAG: cysteine--tRNA ligase [Lactobacillales bacterium]|nr:cysteine--tRNA ligase [Lactobacillales bacterium]
MKLYNTLTRTVEEFIPNNKDCVTMYTCGPTVYHYAHIGNLRTYIFEDVLEKTLNYIGYNVKRCMNITDVGHLTSDSDSGEDKMLKGAKREHKTVLEIADYYTNEFKKDTEKLNIKWPEIVSKATDNIDMYINIVEKLLKDEYAYISGGNVYFDTSKLEDYYKLTNHNVDEMVVGVREGVEEDLSKKNQADFVLWFTKSKFDDQELKWDSPWGVGYPGWHIECSGISIKNLGEYLDIHCGGIDNIFPHHTNEIAQSESYLGHKWCSYWVHGEYLNDETGKMSKSKGEFLTVSLLEEKGYSPIHYRFMCLNSSYRKVLVFSYDALDQARNSYQKLKNKIKSLNKNLNKELDNVKTEEYKNKFKEALENDLNTSLALTVIYDLLKDDVNDTTKLYLIEDFDKVLSLDLLKEEKVEVDSELLEYINSMINKRNEAKQNKDYALADQIRNELEEKGILIKDTREGTIYELK